MPRNSDFQEKFRVSGRNSEFQTPSFRVSGKSERFRVVVRVSLEFRDSAKIPSFSKEEPKNSEIQDGKFRDSGKIPSFSQHNFPSFRRNGGVFCFRNVCTIASSAHPLPFLGGIPMVSFDFIDRDVFRRIVSQL